VESEKGLETRTGSSTSPRIGQVPCFFCMPADGGDGSDSVRGSRVTRLDAVVLRTGAAEPPAHPDAGRALATTLLM
jgi:hypothetical protein